MLMTKTKQKPEMCDFLSDPREMVEHSEMTK